MAFFLFAYTILLLWVIYLCNVLQFNVVGVLLPPWLMNCCCVMFRSICPSCGSFLKCKRSLKPLFSLLIEFKIQTLISTCVCLVYLLYVFYVFNLLLFLCASLVYLLLSWPSIYILIQYNTYDSSCLILCDLNCCVHYCVDEESQDARHGHYFYSL